MHCPRCGQQQVSEETKFCSRCGLPLGLVSEILMHGGFLPQLADLQKNKKWLTRKNALKFSFSWFLVLTFILTPLLALADFEDGAAFFAIVGMMGALVMTIFSFLFLPKEQNFYTNENILQGMPQPAQFAGRPQNQNALPPQMSQPVETYMPPAGSWKAPNTGELARPGSVTENTTKLLKKEE
jgi:predicted nucleic-acid-binding Zn-ribbon protein